MISPLSDHWYASEAKYFSCIQGSNSLCITLTISKKFSYVLTSHPERRGHTLLRFPASFTWSVIPEVHLLVYTRWEVQRFTYNILGDTDGNLTRFWEELPLDLPFVEHKHWCGGRKWAVPLSPGQQGFIDPHLCCSDSLYCLYLYYSFVPGEFILHSICLLSAECLQFTPNLPLLGLFRAFS